MKRSASLVVWLDLMTQGLGRNKRALTEVVSDQSSGSRSPSKSVMGFRPIDGVDGTQLEFDPA